MHALWQHPDLWESELSTIAIDAFNAMLGIVKVSPLPALSPADAVQPPLQVSCCVPCTRSTSSTPCAQGENFWFEIGPAHFVRWLEPQSARGDGAERVPLKSKKQLGQMRARRNAALAIARQQAAGREMRIMLAPPPAASAV